MPLEAPMAKSSETPKRKANPALLKPVQPDAMLAVVVGSRPFRGAR